MISEDNFIKNAYKIQVGDMTVEMQYSKDNKRINECILNILKQKVKL